MENKNSREKVMAEMQEVLKLLPQKAREREKENKRFFQRLKKKHQAEFERTDCLTCANCCKTTGPLFTRADVERISRHFKMKASKFEEAYLRTDEEGDLVLQQLPCPFLGADNYCGIYEVRPKACREYPHTDRRRFEQLGKLTIKNTFVCPAAFSIVEEMKKRIEV